MGGLRLFAPFDMKKRSEELSFARRILGALSSPAVCAAAFQDGARSRAGWTDISIQDGMLRAKILKAFQMLKQAAGDRDAPAGAK